ncbi:hypothetical protein REPUB_Repub20aG0111600 [Reevesia pubescens]
MEELREIAKAYYEVASNDIKEEAWKFFKEMDDNSDGSVNLHEFLDFMRQEQYHHLKSSDLFNQLRGRNRKNLEFMDVMTLYYIFKSGRPFCDGCNQFIKEIYFCCNQCFHSSNENYCLCLKCFKAKKYNTRSHSHHHQFVDNFTLLELKRIDGLKSASTSNQERRRKRDIPLRATKKLFPVAGSSSTALVPAVSSSTSLVPAVSSSTALVPATEVVLLFLYFASFFFFERK